jgi:hypothetical protein
MSDPENSPHWRRNARYEHVFAIVRVDTYVGVDMGVEPEVAITVTKVVREREIAEAEVARLNLLNGPKGSSYFWTITRLEPRPGKGG